MQVSTLSNDIAIALGLTFLVFMLWILFFSKAPDEPRDAADGTRAGEWRPGGGDDDQR